jgi:hypothetical protein
MQSGRGCGGPENPMYRQPAIANLQHSCSSGSCDYCAELFFHVLAHAVGKPVSADVLRHGSRFGRI